MIETPAAVMISDELAELVDFFSIGTNDLTQYTMSVDRGNKKVSYLYSTFNPAVLRSIRHIIACGREAGIMVGMCGEAAADPLLIPLLISFGLGEFSVSATSVLRTRGTIAKWSKADADASKKLEDAKKMIDLEREKALNDLRASVTGLAMTATAKLLSEQAGPESDKKRYQAFLASAGEKHD